MPIQRSLIKDIQRLEKPKLKFDMSLIVPDHNDATAYFNPLIEFAVKANLGIVETLFLVVKANESHKQNEISKNRPIQKDLFPVSIYQLIKGKGHYFSLSSGGITQSLCTHIIEELVKSNIIRHPLNSGSAKKYIAIMNSEIEEIAVNSAQFEHEYFEAKNRYYKIRDELGEITYAVQNQELENRNITTRYREKFPEIIDVKAALMQQEQLKTQLQILSENPDLNLEDVLEKTKEQRVKNKNKLLKMRLDASMGDRKAWIQGYGISASPEELEKEINYGKQLSRKIANLTHDDAVKRNPNYRDLTDKQKKELQDIFKSAMQIKPDEIGFYPNQVGFNMRSSVELKSILNKIKSILDNAGIDIQPGFLPAGVSLKEKIKWFKEQSKLFELQVEQATLQLMEQLNNPDIKKFRDHLACPESYAQIRSRLKKLAIKLEEKNAEYAEIISEIVHSRGD